MLTIDDIRVVPLFSTLAASDLERVAQTSADLRLATGEWAVAEGGERALFAVLAGRIEVVKMFDGVERRLGWRLPGGIFGEVPLASGSPFPGGYRATEPSRAMRVEPPEARVTLLGPQWDAACSDMRRFLTRNQITCEWVTPESPNLHALWRGPLPDAADWPVLQLADGTLISRPKARDLAQLLGLQTRARLTEYDTAIVRARTVILATGVTWRRFAVDGVDRLIGKGVYYGAARSEASAAHGADIHLIGAGNSAGQAALYFASHARTVTLLVRGSSLGKGMSHYLIDQLHSRSNIAVRLRSEVAAVHGDTHLAAISIQEVGTATVTRHECGGLFIFIGADADTGWLPAEIARDTRGYVLTGDKVASAGRWSHDRDPYLLETSVPTFLHAAMCGSARSSGLQRRSVKEAWRLHWSISFCNTIDSGRGLTVPDIAPERARAYERPSRRR